MPDRSCSTSRCGKPNAPHRARLGSGYWCMSCLDHWRRHDEDPAHRQALRPVLEACPVVEDGAPCGRPVVVKRTGWCESHRKVALRNGSPTSRKRAGRVRLLDLVLGAARAADEECIIPAGWEQRPIVRLEGQQMTAARAVWTLAHGDPGQAHVLHTCNEGDGSHGCISIRHPYLGDNDQNTRDRMDAERQARGEGHGRHILTVAQVQDIRRRHVPGTGPYNRGNTRDLAGEFTVAESTIRAAVRGDNWGWLQGGAPGGDDR
ncbi:hypothetical protein ACGFR8_07950 [Streptomyces brevispora]|uniref:hypothetical protein n=1 Tax=Streptomyces brevispora TaxID=887462 RepID=UPI0037115A47